MVWSDQMSEPDISSMITVTGPARESVSDAVAPVTVASEPENKRQENVDVEPTAEQDAPKESESTPERQSKSKEERIKDGSKIEKKINSLYKGQAEERARAERAESELRQTRQKLDELKAQQSKVDLDTMNFDDRVAYLAKNHVSEEMLSNKAAALEQDFQAARDAEWELSAEDFRNKAADAASTRPDYYDVLENAKDALAKLPYAVTEAVITSKNGAAVAYELAKNPDLVKQLYTTNPIIAAQILLEIEQSVRTVGNVAQSAPVSKPQVHATPKITPTQTSAGSVQNHWELPMEHFMARKQQLFGKRF
jgi:hypothetical protein